MKSVADLKTINKLKRNVNVSIYPSSTRTAASSRPIRCLAVVVSVFLPQPFSLVTSPAAEIENLNVTNLERG